MAVHYLEGGSGIREEWKFVRAECWMSKMIGGENRVIEDPLLDPGSSRTRVEACDDLKWFLPRSCYPTVG